MSEHPADEPLVTGLAEEGESLPSEVKERMEELDREDYDDLQTILEPHNLKLFQQILASDTGTLSLEEIAYRNPGLSEEMIEYRLMKLSERERPFITTLSVTPSSDHLPSTYYAVTERAISLLQTVNAYEGISLIYQMYQHMDQTDRIKEIEDLGDHPRPDWLPLPDNE